MIAPRPTRRSKYGHPRFLVALGWTAFVLFVLVILYAILANASAQNKIGVVGCRGVRYPAVCVASYHRCDNIGLNDACLAVAQLDGRLGYDAANGRTIPMSQNK
jgi:hypothetical protein